MEKQIQLGDVVKCKYSGFKGTVVAKTEFINGCVQYSLTAKHPKSKEFIPAEDVSIDEESLEIVSKKKKPVVKKKKDTNGGPMRIALKMRGY